MRRSYEESPIEPMSSTSGTTCRFQLFHEEEIIESPGGASHSSDQDRQLQQHQHDDDHKDLPEAVYPDGVPRRTDNAQAIEYGAGSWPEVASPDLRDRKEAGHPEPVLPWMMAPAAAHQAPPHAYEYPPQHTPPTASSAYGSPAPSEATVPAYPPYASHWSPTTAGGVEPKMRGMTMTTSMAAVGGMGGKGVGTPDPAMLGMAGTMAADGFARRRKRRVMLALGALAAAIIIGLAVGLGVSLSQRDSSSSSSGSAVSDPATSDPASNPDSNPGSSDPGSSDGNGTVLPVSIMHPRSQLASLNFTDAEDQQHMVVAWQDRYCHLVFSHWDPALEGWRKPVNVTGGMAATVRPVAGTPIAVSGKSSDVFGVAATRGNTFQLNFYYADSNYNIIETLCYDDGFGEWALGQLSYSDIAIRPGSGLSAFWAPYLNASNYWPMVFAQGEQGAVRALAYNGSVEQWQDKGEVVSLGAPTPLTVTPFFDTLMNGPSVRIYYANDGDLLEASPWETQFGWDTSPERSVNTASAGSNTSISAIGWGSQRWTQILAAAVPMNGTGMVLSWWPDNPGPWSRGAPTYKNLPAAGNGTASLLAADTRIGAVTLSQDMRAYVFTTPAQDGSGTGGNILQFSISAQNPFEWTYTGLVGLA